MASKELEMKKKPARKTGNIAVDALELAELHVLKRKPPTLQNITNLSYKYTSQPAKELALKTGLPKLDLPKIPHPKTTSSETSRLETDDGRPPVHEILMTPELNKCFFPVSTTMESLRKTDALRVSRSAEKFPYQLNDPYDRIFQSQNLTLDVKAMESDRSHSPSSLSAKSSTSNFLLTPNLNHSPMLRVESRSSAQEISSGSDTDQSDTGARSKENESKNNLVPKNALFRTGTFTKKNFFRRTSLASKEYMNDTAGKVQESEIKSLIDKKSVTKASTSPYETQQVKEKPKLKKSLSMIAPKPALRRRRRSEVPIIKIDDHIDPDEDYKLENSGQAPKRKPSILERMMPSHSPKSYKRKGRKKSKFGDLLDASDLSEAHASDPNLLGAEQLHERNFRENAGQELRRFYSKLSVPLPSLWTKKHIKISDIFVEPILSFNRKEVPMENIFVVKPNRSSKNPIIVIKGQPGAGKTALCQYLVHSWSRNENRVKDLDMIELLFMIECRYVTSNLRSLLRTTYLKDSISKLPRAERDTEYLFEVINKSKALIILDGFDEIQDSSRLLLENIKSSLPDAKVVVTTRLSGIRDIQETLMLDVSYDVVEFLVKLFDEEQLVSLILNISNIYGVTDENQNELLEHIDDDKLLSMLRVPLHLILYLMLWIHDPNIFAGIKTVIDVFDGVISSMCVHLPSCVQTVSGEPLPSEQVVQSWLHRVGHVCLQRIQARQFYFASPEYSSLKPYSDALGMNQEKALKLIMQEVTYLAGENLRTFCHVTVMEHLAASFMDSNIVSNSTGIFETLAPSKLSNAVSVNCWKSCVSMSSTPAATVTNSGTRNYQLDSAISHLAHISTKNDHNTFKMGKELATYFSLNNNRNLVTLSNIISFRKEQDDPFKHGLKKGLSNQNLPEQIHIWNLKHVINLIEYGALKPSVPVKFTVENSKEWGTIVNKLVNLGCKPYINVVIEDGEQLNALVCALKVIEKPKVPKLILHFGFIDVGINDLVAGWPYPKTLHIVSPKGKYAIESYLACILLVKAMGKTRVKNIRFTGHESSYIFGLLKNSLKEVSIQLQPYARDYVQFEIFMQH